MFMCGDYGAAGRAVVIRSGDFDGLCRRIIRSRDAQGIRPRVRAGLDGLHPAVDAQLVEQPAGVRLHRIFANEQGLRDLAGAHAAGNVLKDFQFPGRNAQRPDALRVDGERPVDRGDAHLFDDHHVGLPGDREPEPDPDAGKQHGDQRRRRSRLTAAGRGTGIPRTAVRRSGGRRKCRKGGPLSSPSRSILAPPIQGEARG